MAANNKGNTSVSIDSEIIETIIGADTRFKGKVKTDKTILIYGEFEGTIDSDSLVILSETGIFSGTMNCRELRLFGHARGNISCSELCKFSENGVFNGDLATKNLVFVEGSQIDGTIKMETMRKAG